MTTAQWVVVFLYDHSRKKRYEAIHDAKDRTRDVFQRRSSF